MYIFNYNKLIKNLPEIKSNTYEEYDMDGFYSVNIFGPIKNYVCACNKMGRPNTQCETCGMYYTKSEVRDTTMARIRLPYKIIHPFILYKSSKHVVNLLKDPSSILGKDKLENMDDVLKVIKSIKPIYYLIEKFEKNNSLWVEDIIVISPSYRPKMYIDNQEKADDLTILYRSLFNTCEAINNNIFAKNIVFHDTIYTLYKDVSKILTHLARVIPKKKGLLRQYILGKRADFTARCVIVPDPTLDITTVGVPYSVLVDLTRPFLVHKIENSNSYKMRNSENIIQMYKRYNMEKEFIENKIDEIIKDKVVIINRQPTLHRLGMGAFNIIGHHDSVLKINPLIVKPFNADQINHRFA